MAFTAVAALAGGAEVTASVVLSAMAEVGTVMSVVGAVTGSKDLMKIGGAMGLIGGVGGLVNGAAAGAAGSADAFATQAAGGAAGAGDIASGLGAGDPGAALSAASSADAAATAAQGASAPLPAAQTTLPTPDASGIVGGGQQAATTQSVAMPGPQTIQASSPTDVAGAPGVQTPVGAQAPVGAVSPADYTNPTDMRLQAGTQTSPLNAPIGSQSYFSQFLDFANKNSKLVSGAAVLVGGALTGANQRDMNNQRLQLERDRMARANTAGNFAPTNGIINAGRPA